MLLINCNDDTKERDKVALIYRESSRGRLFPKGKLESALEVGQQLVELKIYGHGRHRAGGQAGGSGRLPDGGQGWSRDRCGCQAGHGVLDSRPIPMSFVGRQAGVQNWPGCSSRSVTFPSQSVVHESVSTNSSSLGVGSLPFAGAQKIFSSVSGTQSQPLGVDLGFTAFTLLEEMIVDLCASRFTQGGELSTQYMLAA